MLAPILLATMWLAPADVVVSPGDVAHGLIADAEQVLVRVAEDGAYLLTATPALLPRPPLRLAAGEHVFRFDDEPGHVRYEVACETAEDATQRLLRSAMEGSPDAAASIDALARRSDDSVWHDARGEIHFATGVSAARARTLDVAIDHLRTATAIARDRENAALESSCARFLATLLCQIDDVPGGLEAAARHREIERASGDVRATAEAELWYGGLLSVLGFADRALQPLTAASEAAATLDDPGLEARAQLRLGDVASTRGDRAAARDAYLAALSRGKSARDVEAVAMSAIRLGLLERDAFRFDAAIERFREVDELDGADALYRLEARSWIARCHLLRGDYHASLAGYEDLIRRAAEDDQAYFEMIGIQGSANALVRIGAFAEARRSYRRALAASERQTEGLRRNEILRHLARLERLLGRAEEARALLEESLRLARTRHDLIEEVSALVDLATLLREEGRFELAAARLDEARARAADHEDLAARVAAGLAALLLDTGDVDGAVAAATHARDTLGDARGTGGSRAVLPVLARGLLLAGRRDEARAVATRAIEQAAPSDADAQLEPLAVLAAAALDDGDLDGAAAVLDDAVSHLDRLAGSGALEIDAATGLRSHHAEFAALRHDLTAALAASGDDAAVVEGFAAAGTWKGRGLLEGIREHRRGGRTREISVLRERAERLRDRRAAALELVFQRTHGDAGDASALREEAARLSAELDAVEAELGRVSPRDAALARPAGASVAEVQRTLRDGDLLVEFVEGRSRLRAFVVGRDEFRLHDLGALGSVRESTERYLALVAQPSRLGGVAEVAREGHALFELLLAEPFRGAPPRRLIVVPSISLSVLPFEALVLETPDDPASFADVVFLDDRTETSYAPSAPVLLTIAEADERPDGGRVLALADPLYGPEAGERLAGPRRLAKTRGEALALTSLLLGDDAAARPALAELAVARSGSFEHEAVTLHLGGDATRARLLVPLRDVRILHLAAHGIVRRDSLRASGVVLSYREGEPDLFSIRDALRLDLDAQLVVLSACSTARGRPRRGEGIESLARAFLHAGARSVVASLWDVSDDAAVRTMERFYRSLLRDERPPAEALRVARRALRGATADAGERRGVGATRPAPTRIPAGHPFLWAPFIHVGAPGRDGRHE